MRSMPFWKVIVTEEMTPFFMEEEGKLLGPLSQKLKLLADYSNPKAIQFAKEQGIHESNILKLSAFLKRSSAGT